MPNFELSIIFFLQIAVILAACRIVGWIGRLVGQSQVVGEMIAGVLLGPSLLGAFWPGLYEWLFPPQSRAVIYCVAQVGLALYMFVVGLEFRTDILRARVRSAVSISLAGIITPFALGGLLATQLHGDTRYFGADLAAWKAVVFMGAAMSITAFPMLARIIVEQRLSGTKVGTLALAAGSIDDALAWCLLAVVLAGLGGSPTVALLAIGGGAAYAVVVLTVGRRLLRRLDAGAVSGENGEALVREGNAAEEARPPEPNAGPGMRDRIGESRASDRVALDESLRPVPDGHVLPPGTLAIVLIVLALASWYTDRIGIYAVFGAFILGLAMPRGRFNARLCETLEPITSALLLPMFFVYSGLNTRITLVDSPALWGLTLVVLAAACAGKGLACWAAARLHGEPPRDAAAIGALMNARGLMELIILNIGLERGVITPTLFSIMVIMAIVTTLMATPLFQMTRRGAGQGERAEALTAGTGG